MTSQEFNSLLRLHRFQREGVAVVSDNMMLRGSRASLKATKTDTQGSWRWALGCQYLQLPISSHHQGLHENLVKNDFGYSIGMHRLHRESLFHGPGGIRLSGLEGLGVGAMERPHHRLISCHRYQATCYSDLKPRFRFVFAE